MIPPPTVLQHGKVGVKEGGVQRHMENRMDGRRGRDTERVMIAIFAFTHPPTQTIKWAYPWRALPHLPHSPLWKWNPHLNTHDDIWIHLSPRTLMGSRGNSRRPFCGAESAEHANTFFFCHCRKINHNTHGGKHAALPQVTEHRTGISILRNHK